MPNPNEIKKTMLMKNLNIPQDVLIELGFDAPEYKPRHENFEMFVKMNDMLTTEQKCAVMERQGCHKAGLYDKESKEWGEKHNGKTIVEKLEIMSSEGNHFMPVLNGDGTLSMTIGCYDGDNFDSISHGCHCLNGDKFNTFVEKHPDKVFSFRQMWCGCCLGHQKHHLQNKLGVKLRLKSVDAREKMQKCVYVYEITAQR